jgi:hypothetical protein
MFSADNPPSGVLLPMLVMADVLACGIITACVMVAFEDSFFPGLPWV